MIQTRTSPHTGHPPSLPPPRDPPPARRAPASRRSRWASPRAAPPRSPSPRTCRPPRVAAPAPTLDVAALRAQGPAALDALLARFDHMAPGSDRDQLAARDRRGRRRSATRRPRGCTGTPTSRRPGPRRARSIGRSSRCACWAASTRTCRAPTAGSSARPCTPTPRSASFLRQGFVLYWSSERPVPRVTIDFGDGRKLERTTTGNSAHYVLDADGNVLDVLPGLYAPAVFQAELAKSARLAHRVRGLDGAARARAVAEHHRRELEAAAARLQSVAGTQFVRGRGRLLGQGRDRRLGGRPRAAGDDVEDDRRGARPRQDRRGRRLDRSRRPRRVGGDRPEGVGHLHGHGRGPRAAPAGPCRVRRQRRPRRSCSTRRAARSSRSSTTPAR